MVEERKAKFTRLEQMARVFTDEYSRAFHSRMYSLMPELDKAVPVMSEQASKLLGTMRDGDQVGALMAGCWMITHDKAPTAAEALEFLTNIEIGRLKDDSETKSDEELCLDEIMSQRMEILTKSGRIKTSIGGAMELWFGQASGLHEYYSNQDEYPGLSQDIIRRELEQLGLKPEYKQGVEYLYVSLSHPQLKKQLRDSGWANSYASLLSRLPNCTGIKGPASFSGVKKRYLEIVLQNDEIPF